MVLIAIQAALTALIQNFFLNLLIIIFGLMLQPLRGQECTYRNSKVTEGSFDYSISLPANHHLGGALDGWQGVGYDNCEALIGPEFVNVRRRSLGL